MKNISKKKLHMSLPQTEGKSNEDLYSSMRDRARTKSAHAYIDKGEEPVQMILNIDHPVMDIQASVVVAYQSFELIKNGQEEEIGFTAVVFQPLSDDRFLMTVFKRGKGYLENLADVEKAMKNKKKKKKPKKKKVKKKDKKKK